METIQVRRGPGQWAVLPGNKGQCKGSPGPGGLGSLQNARGQTGGQLFEAGDK